MSGKKKTILIVALLLVVFIGSISYALWSVTLEQTDSNIVKTGCFTVDMVEQTDEINLPEEYPVTDAEGRKYSPFTFTIQNTCTIDSSYSVNLKVDSSSTLEHQYVKAVLDGDKAQVLTDYKKATNEDKYQLTTGTLAGASAEGAGDGESVTYNLRLWLDADTPETQMSKDFYAKIIIENITTSGVVAREVLSTGDISEAGDGSVTYTYYSDGQLNISGTGRMRESEMGGLGIEIVNELVSKEEFTSTLTDGEKAILSSEMRMALVPIISDNYKVMILVFKNGLGITDESLCSELPENFDDYKGCLSELGFSDENLHSLLDKVNDYLIKISSINISEGILNVSNLLASVRLEKLELPSTLIEVGSYSFRNTDIPLIRIPNSVTITGTDIVDTALVGTIVLPKNNTYTNLYSKGYLFSSARDLVVIIPNTITDLGGAFNQAKNITLKFEASESEVPETVKERAEGYMRSGNIVEIIYGYQYES